MGKIKIYEEKGNIPYEEITKVLNLAYKELLDQSLSYAAATQTVEKTKARMKNGVCMIAEIDGKIVGTLTYHVHEKKENSKWYIDGKYIVLTQLAVLPEYREHNVYLCLASNFLRKVRKDKEIACLIADTSVEAERLVKGYVSLGMQIVDYVSWPGTNYYSYVFCKTINGKKFQDEYCEKRLKIAKLKCKLQYKKNGQKRVLGKIVTVIKRI